MQIVFGIDKTEGISRHEKYPLFFAVAGLKEGEFHRLHGPLHLAAQQPHAVHRHLPKLVVVGVVAEAGVGRGQGGLEG